MFLLGAAAPLQGAGIAIVVWGDDPNLPLIVGSKPPSEAKVALAAAAEHAAASDRPRLELVHGPVDGKALRGLRG